MTTFQSASRLTVAPDDRVEQLRQKLGYPVQQRDPQGSDFFYLRPGDDAEEAEETCPIAVGFYPELNEVTDERSLQQLLTSSEWQQRIYGHYLSRTAEQQPVMYILMPAEEGAGQVPLILPTEGGLRQRNIQTFAWGSAELETRLNRLRQEELPVASRALTSVPLVERAFYKPIQTAKELAQLLATAARRIEQILPEVYQDEKRRYLASKGEEGYLHQLLKSFQQELLPSLQLVSENEKDYSFSDIYAQTIAYSLFTARVFGYVRDREAGQKEELFDRASAWQQLPETNPFLRKLFQDVSERSADELGDGLIGAIADIFAILRAAKMDVILQDFRQKQNREDIVIRFYEDFLAAYKPQMRERRGVYYTPEPVVSYMVRSVDVLLKEKFDKPLGLADPEVMILDPACGTGTFLLWICQLIHDLFHAEREAMIAKVGDISWSEYVSEHLLPRIFGFELLMAPYAIAHLKLGLFLRETGYEFDSGKRLEIYLTNALEEAVQKSEFLLKEFISEESNQASKIKQNEPIMVVVGNPPYSIHSQNLTAENRALVNAYKFVDGQPIKEKGALQFEKNIQNDYVKFIRFSQSKISQTGHGILAFITDNGYLDNPTFRGMRQNLAKTFNEIYLLDLHGNSKRNEKNSTGDKEENVFDIQQGVAVSFFVKTSEQEFLSRVKHLGIWGTRESKYNWLNKEELKVDEFELLAPVAPSYLFKAQNALLGSEYYKGWNLTEIMFQNSAGVITARDNTVIDFTVSPILERAEIFRDSSLSSVELCRFLDIALKKGWDVEKARRSIKEEMNLNAHIQKITYRPFDSRYIFYHPSLVWGMAFPTMRHMISLEDNLSLVATRQTKEIFGVLVSDELSAHKLVSVYDTNSVFPLYLYPETKAEKAMGMVRRPNLSQLFLNDITDCLGYTPTPEAIFRYIYSIFHSPTYRSRYAEFLKIDFPRVPLTRNDALFRQLAVYGEQLVALHLMKSPNLDRPITEFVDQGGNAIVDPAHPKFSNGSVIINKKGDRFVGVPEPVWNFYVGGYQVCAKWLKDRKGRTLTPEDIRHYQRIVVALQETMQLMQQIDAAIPEFPIV